MEAIVQQKKENEDCKPYLNPGKPLPGEKSMDDICDVAQKMASQPVQVSDPRVWGVLTAISDKARKRSQGINILLDGDEHIFGRSVKGPKSAVISFPAVSGFHCKISRKKLSVENGEEPSYYYLAYLKDTSTNGTFLNWTRLTKDAPAAELQHGDIVSLVHPPENENAYVFVYREVKKDVCSPTMIPVLKRKQGDVEEFVAESKRLKGLGIGAPDGPVSLDDVRRLQRSNEDLRKQLESHVLTIETLNSENRACAVRHENELKELRESVSQSYLDEIKDLRHTLNVRQKELAELSALSADRQNSIEDLNQQLAASTQSRTDAEEILQSQTATISELEAQLEEERNQRRNEREKSMADLQAALQRARSEAQEELKRQAGDALRQQREQQEVINKLQEADKESRLLVETLRSKLEDTRESFVKSEKKVRQLEAQLHEEQLASADAQKKAATVKAELRRLEKELENEKQVAREEAWAKVSALELEMAAAIRDLSIEKQRFQGARERIILRESQLRAFYSTTEEISALFAKQQQQLKAMQRALEDEENGENTTANVEIEQNRENISKAPTSSKGAQRSKSAGETSTASTRKGCANESMSDTSIHICKQEAHLGAIIGEERESIEKRIGEERESGHTNDEGCTSNAQEMKGFGSDIEAIGTELEHGHDLMGTEQVHGVDLDGTEMVEIGLGARRSGYSNNANLAGETMEIDDEAQTNMELDIVRESSNKPKRSSSSQAKEPETLVELDVERERDDDPKRSYFPGENDQHKSLKRVEDTEEVAKEEDNQHESLKTADLLASELPGSWAMSTAPSFHGENESPRSGCRAIDAQNDGEEDQAWPELLSQVATSGFKENEAMASQNMPLREMDLGLSQEHQALSEMIDIVAPDFRQQFQKEVESESSSGEETQAYSSEDDSK
ncbi:paramyosin isoform X1 [Amborella trichopoda]|uniref:paramyosin isoform X1 n=1 Tax=Amborella trichopoda TaxID=13333 RepID=UPI0005D38A0A|nr:paramyosin isoform X1 [Amborella trichopoda]|eukprot:XP_011628403.1 paramyosin isoform X1 [Amborella trichopoda]